MELLIGVSVGLQVSLVFLHRPHVHLKEAHQGEQKSYVTNQRKAPTRKRVCEDGEANPRAHFSTIVGTRHESEQRSHGNGTLLRTVCLSHAAELDMNGSVDAFANTHGNQGSDEHCSICHRCIEGVAQRVSNLWVRGDDGEDEESESPVVGAVLEQVCERHRAVRELVDKEGLEETLRVMECPGDHCDSTESERYGERTVPAPKDGGRSCRR